MSVMRATGIEKEYFGRAVLDGVHFDLEQGECVGLVGENGTGKSTLMKILAGVERADRGEVRTASSVVVTYLSQHLDDMIGDEDLSLPVRATPQIKRLEEEMVRVADQLAAQASSGEDHDAARQAAARYQKLTETYRRIDGYSYPARYAQALAGMGIRGEMLDRPMRTLSGGERMRAMIAKRLLENPDVLLLDEPTNHLDLDGLEWLEDYLSSFKGAVVVISHDRYFLDRTADRICEMRGGHLTSYPGNYTRYLALKEEEERLKKLEIERLEDQVTHEEEVAQTTFEHRNFSTYHARQKKVAQLKEKLETARRRLDPGPQRMSFRFIPREVTSDPSRIIISADDVGIAYDGPPLFHDVSFELRAQDKVVIAGPNGCGKTTLLKILLGEIGHFTGRVLVSSTIRYAVMDQYVRFEDERITVLEELMLRSELPEGPARNLLARYGFRGIDVHKAIHVLSGGERSRLYLCCLLEEHPDVLFLDEPTNHLDIPSREILEDALRDFRGCILAVSHDRYFIERCADQVLGFADRTLGVYPTYAAYRREVHRRENPPGPPSSPSGKKASAPRRAPRSPEPAGDTASLTDTDPATGRSLNKAESRRLRAKLQREASELEARIEALEAEQEELEAKMQDGGAELYARYAAFYEELETLYGRYYAIAEHPLMM